MRLRLLAAFGLAFGLITATVAQEKKDSAPPDKKAETKAPDAKAPDAKAAAPAADNPLAWKFVKDQPFWQEMTTRTIQNIRVQGLEVGQNQEQTFYFKFDPQKQEGDKWVVKQTIEGVKMKIAVAAVQEPHLDACARDGVCGLSIPVLPGITPGSGPGHLGLFGYDPLEYRIGRGILEALGINFPVGDRDVAVRGNFVTLDNGKIKDRRAGRPTTD